MERYSKRRITFVNTPIRPPVLIPRASSALVGERRLPFVRVSSRQTNDLTIVTAPWSETIYRPDVMQRLALQAEALDSTVVAIANPGVHSMPLRYDHDSLRDRGSVVLAEPLLRLTSSERQHVAAGHFDEVAALQWEALRGLLAEGRFKDARLTILGNSLGATAAAALVANAPSDVRVDHLVLCESVGRMQNLFELAGKFKKESEKWEQYKAERPEWAEPMQSPLSAGLSIARQPLHNLAYARGLVSHDVVTDVKAGYASGTLDDESTVTIVSGSESHVSPESENDKLANKIGSAIRSTVRQLVLDGESHALLDSPNRYAALMHETRR